MPTPPGSPVRLQEPQAVLTPLTAAALFLVVTIDAGAEGAVRDLLADLAGLERTVGFRVPTAGLALVTGIGSDAWDRLFTGPRPAELHPFRELHGERHHAVSTPGDLLFHIRAAQADLCFELASQIMDRLTGSVTVVDEVHGFKYFDDRDLLGFVDGTENPTGTAATDAVTVGDEDPGFSGSSYVIVQKYLHDLTTWNALSVEDQELVVGRRKLSNVELSDDEKPSNSHVALNTVVGPDGEQRQILRDNMAFGTIGQGEFGTYFIGYAATPSRDRADAREHVHRRSAGELRPDPRLLDRASPAACSSCRPPTSSTTSRPRPATSGNRQPPAPSRTPAPSRRAWRPWPKSTARSGSPD